MAARRNTSPPFRGRPVQTPGLMRHGPFPGLGASSVHRSVEPLPRLLEDKVSVQKAEIEQLAGDNHRLVATHVAMRQDLVATQQEVDGLRAHIRSMQTESDIQIRVLLDKISKRDVEIRSGENVKKDLEQAHAEAQSLVLERHELSAKVQRATQELQKADADARRLPELHVELDSLRQEHQRLRAAFEYEKGLNIQLVEQMQGLEKNLVGIAREVEKLRADVLTAETRAIAPNQYGSGPMNPDPLHPSSIQGSDAYDDGYVRPHVQMGAELTGEGAIPYGSANGVGGAAW